MRTRHSSQGFARSGVKTAPRPRCLLRSFAVLVAAVAQVAVPASAAGSGARTTDASEGAFRSRALGGTLHFSVVLRATYGDGRRYPVVCFLHGLPAGESAFRDTSLVRGALARLDRPAIAIVPQGARAGDSDPEYLDRGPARNWETALSRELPAYVDSRFRTIPNRRGRAVVGVSAGGYGAMLIGIKHLDTFSVIQSWSGYHRPTDPAGLRTLDLGSPRANACASVHTYVRALRRSFTTRPTRLGFYVGKSDARFRADNVRLDAELSAARVPHLFRLYPGGHERSLWTGHSAAWLELALAGSATPFRRIP